MKSFACLVIWLISMQASAGETDAWIRPVSIRIPEAKILRPILGDRLVEVSVSKFEAAANLLIKRPIHRQEAHAAGSFGRPGFACNRRERLFLVRAVYSNGSTGTYNLQRVDDALWVRHSSLGRSTGTHRSALLVAWTSIRSPSL